MPPSASGLGLLFKKLFDYFGPQHWWPADSPFEVMVGAILTQNTNWLNVEKAIANLKKEKLLSPLRLHRIDTKKLSLLIRPAGYYNIKARRLKNFLDFFWGAYKGSVSRMRREDTVILRAELLNVNGIGQETADSILLYALGKPVFVIDAYTKRLLHRHTYGVKQYSYESAQQLFVGGLKKDEELFNEFHALIVRLAKEFCFKNNPRCQGCPLEGFRLKQ